MQTLALDYKNRLVGQGYDGASVMSGKHRGVVALIKADAKLALFVHCHAHRLNLALVDSVKAVQVAAEFFVLLEKLYVYVSGSFVHARWLEIQKLLFPGERPRELQRLSDTRWSRRYAACRAVRDRLTAVLKLLDELASGNNANRAVEARSLLNAVDMHFVVMLVLMCDIFGRTQALSCMMQSSTLDLSRAVDMIEVTRGELADNRKGDAHFDKVWTDAMSLCQLCHIPCCSTASEGGSTMQPTQGSREQAQVVTSTRAARERRLPARFHDSIVMVSVGDRPVTDDKKSFRTTVYLPVLDNLCSELERRFDETQCSVMRGIQALNPINEHFAELQQIRSFAEAYDADVADLEHELHQVKRLIARLTSAKPDSLVTFVSFIGRYGDAFHELHRLGKIAVALPVSTASCERSFSALRHIKTWVRNSMSNGRLSNVAVLAIERERTMSMSNDKVIDAFAAAHQNRRIALI